MSLVFGPIYVAYLEAGPWCDCKCLPPKAMSHWFEFENLPLQTIFGEKMLKLSINHPLPNSANLRSFVHCVRPLYVLPTYEMVEEKKNRSLFPSLVNNIYVISDPH